MDIRSSIHQIRYFSMGGFFRSRKPITIVTYHSISNVSDGYTISPAAFYRQIQFIHSNFSIIRLHEIESVIKNERQSSREVVITFDDAYRDFLECAYPVLENFGVPCTVFVPTGFIGGFNEWNFPYTQCRRRRVMNGIELQELHKSGLVDFGSHTVDHRRMTRLPEDQMVYQAAESRRTLEDLLATPVTMFAYPYGQLDDFSALSSRILSETGYKIAVTAHWGTRNSARDLLGLCRISFRETDSNAIVRAKLEGLYNWVALKEQVGLRVRYIRRTCTGDL